MNSCKFLSIISNMFRNLVTIVFFFLFAVSATAQIMGCTGWETGAETFEKYYAQWKAPSCYSFEFRSYGVHPGSTVKRSVKPGGVRKGPYRAFQTIDDFWKLIEKKCIKSCPNGPYSCNISYATHKKTGLSYPSNVIIGDENDENATIRYIITNFRPTAKNNN